MIGYWQKINLSEYLVNLKDYYHGCEKSIFLLSHKIGTLAEEKKSYVNCDIGDREKIPCARNK